MAAAQACPAGRSCFYVPPALPTPPTFTVDWDMVLASPRGTISGTWRAGTGAPTAFTVSPGTPLVIPLSTTEGTASTYHVAETRGIFVEASSPELIVDHRLIVGPWQSSSTIKSSAFALGRRFRLAGYNLNGNSSPDTGFDYVSVYAPFGGTVTFDAPPGATLPFWGSTAAASFSVTLTAGQTYLARTLPGNVCNRELDAALVTSTEPISVDTGGRGWSGVCSVGGGCGDDGADNVLPTTGLGTQFVIVDYPTPASDGEDVVVIADTAGTQVRINGVLVATLAAGGVHTFTVTGTTYVETTQPAYVYQNTGLTSCEMDIAIIPSLVLAPLGNWVTDFNVPAGFSAQIGVVISTATLASLRVDGLIPVFLSVGIVPGHPELTAGRIAIGAGNHSVRASADYQLGLVTSGGGTGLFAYYTPFRIPGCGDGMRVASEACDDGNLSDGDGCSSTCRIEIGFMGCMASGDCVPAGRCDMGTCVARCFTSAECNDSNACTTDSCDATGACANAPVAAGSPGMCTGGLVCSGAPSNRCVACVSDAQCMVPTPRCELLTNTCIRCLTGPDCDDGNGCTADACTLGGCSNTPLAAGTPCATGVCTGAPSNACVTCIDDSRCMAPTPRCDTGTNMCVACSMSSDCDDSNECTTDSCATGGACSFTAVGDGTDCTGGTCMTGTCSVVCGDGILASTEECDDSNMVAMDGCSPTCTVDMGWACGCTDPVITYSMETLAGRVGGDGGGAGPQQGCTGSDVLIGLAIDWSNSRGEGVRTTTICGTVSVSAGGAVTTTPSTRDTQGGSGCSDWDPSTTSPDVVCPTGFAIVGITGAQSDLGGTPTLFRDLSIVCQQLGADGSAFGPTMTLNVPGGGGGGTPQTVDCAAGSIARFFRTRSGCGQDALDLFCGIPAASCGGSSSICTTLCGDGVVGAPREACDGESATCDADCTLAMCGDGTVNAMAMEDCDGSGVETVTCDLDCSEAECGDNDTNAAAGESCDDGNTMGGDGCSAECVSESCGNSIVEGAESCDDGGESDTCDDDCTPAMCGDARTNETANEDCDEGGETVDCDDDCTDVECGDGTLNEAASEECDDGNLDEGDGCSSACDVEVVVNPDAGVPDAGMEDAGMMDDDAGMSDAGNPYGITGGACGCRAADTGGGTGSLALLAVALLVLARRRRIR